jgi:hypothetical protein
MKMPVQVDICGRVGTARFATRVYHGEEVAAMSKYVEELHNKEDAGSFGNAVLLFVAILVGLTILGVIFWAAV